MMRTWSFQNGIHRIIIFIFSIFSVHFPLANSRPTLPNYLTEHDFANAIFVKTNRPVKAVYNDQRFHKRQRRGSVVALDSDKWPNGRIPYVLSAAYNPQQRAVLARAISAYNAKTCIRFVPKTQSDKDYVVISKLDGCYADFARVGGRQQVSLADECIEYATIIHEFMHVIGFIHEHQREDRDGFVRIVWENVIDGANADFEKLSAVGLSNYGEQYDYFSIMHYESTEGSKNSRPTIMAMVPEYTQLMGKSTDFTEGDLNRVNKAYKCHRYLPQTAAIGGNAVEQQRKEQQQQTTAPIYRQRWARQYWRG